MRWLSVLVLMLSLLLPLSLVDAAFQEKKSDTTPTPKVRGTLPQNYKKLGLRDEQVQRIYRIQADYGAKIAELQKQIDKLRSERNAETEKVLTAEQLKRLKELKSGEKAPE